MAFGAVLSVLIRSLRSLLLFVSIALAYSVQWSVWRVSGRRWLSARWERLHVKSAQRLADGFCALGGVYVKLGQVLSVLGTFLPPAFGTAFGRLQDAVPPRPMADIAGRLQHALGDDWTSHFDDFEQEPLAAASLAQVHRARLKDGTPVAVKVLYPGIEGMIAVDLKVIGWIAPLVYRVFGFRRMGTVVEQLGEMLRQETDFVRERQNLRRMADVLRGQDKVVTPQVFEHLSSAAVLVLSLEEGRKLSDGASVRASGGDPTTVANNLVSAYLSMLLEHRVFHADPHPGNLLVRGNQLVLLDFGAVAQVSEALVGGLKKVIMGGLVRNADQVLIGIEEMGFVADNGDRELLRSVGREYLHALAGIQVSDLRNLSSEQVRSIMGYDQLKGRLRSVASNVRYPEGYFYLERTLLLLFGVVAQLVPEKGLLGIAAPHASKALMRSYAARRASVPARKAETA